MAAQGLPRIASAQHLAHHLHPFPVMRNRGPWIEIAIVGVAIACALAVGLATLGAAAGITVEARGDASEPSSPSPSSSKPSSSQTSAGQPATVQEATERTYQGMVTCSRCGARHPADSGQTATTCSRACVRTGAGFTLVDGETLYLLDGDPELIKKFAGQRAEIAGLIAGNTIRVSSVSAAK